MREHICWSAQGQPISTQFDDFYFSSQNGLEETRYVFLQHNQLAQRFATLDNTSTFVIAETGFGTGLNFLASCHLWTTTAPKQAQLHFISTEKYPLSPTDIAKTCALWPELAPFTQPLVSAYPSCINGFHRISLGNNITLTLIIDDATKGFTQLMASSTNRHWQGVDAWFLDGFAPAKNPDMWNEHLFTVVAALSKPEASLATFTAASMVRKGLSAAGFTMQKSAGYGKKREMLVGQYTACTQTQAELPQTTPNNTWAIIGNHQYTEASNTIAVIGGGIAGCHSAYALAQKGYQVVLFDQHPQLAGEASGNAQGIVYAKLSANAAPQGDFNRYSLLYAQQFYRHYWNSTPKAAGTQCGVLQLSLNDKLAQQHQHIAEQFQPFSDCVAYVSASQASTIANTTIDHSALYLPQAGWIQPAYLCKWLCQHPNITLKHQHKVTQLSYDKKTWQLSIEHQEQQSFDTVVIANANDALAFLPTQHLPTKPVRGQVTHLPVNTESQALSTAICGKGYIAPPYLDTHQQALHCIGASFNVGSMHTQLSTEDHQHNLKHLTQQTPSLLSSDQLVDTTELAGRVGFRCTTPDYLPIVGGAPIAAQIQQTFAPLSKNAHTAIAQTGQYYPNLYLNLGHGSRGLSYTPLCSEILASLIHGDPPPIPQALINRLNPARFIIRDIIRSDSNNKPNTIKKTK